MVQIIRDNARRLERMVHDVLELSATRPRPPEAIRMRSFLLTFIEGICPQRGPDPERKLLRGGGQRRDSRIRSRAPQPSALEPAAQRMEALPQAHW